MHSKGVEIMIMNINIKEALKKYTMVIALIIVSLYFTIKTNGSLLSPANITNLISQNSYVVILAVGMLLCILTGGNIDLSIGSIVALIGAIAGTLIVNKGMNIYIVIPICLLVGLAIGAWQGFWIAYVRIPPFIVTLSGMLVWRGFALIVLNGLTISPFPNKYLNLFNSYFTLNINNMDTTAQASQALGGGSFIAGPKIAFLIGILISIIFIVVTFVSRKKKIAKGYSVSKLPVVIGKTIVISIIIVAVSYKLSLYKGIPTVLILLAVIVSAYSYFTSKTVIGRHFYSVGGNEKATSLSGINTNRIYFIAYTNMAVLAAIAALVCIARFNSAAPTAGTNYEMDTIASCFIGGASAYGGIGTVPGVVVGAIFMGVINNGMSMTAIDTNWQKVVKGFVLLAAAAFDVISKKKSS